MSTIKAILIIVTNFSEIAPGEPTGLWLEEFAVPYMEFKKHGYEITVASIKGGRTPVDPRSKPSPEQTRTWRDAVSALENTLPVASVDTARFAAVFVPGGHGTMYDLPNNPDTNKLLARFAAENKVIAAMCHGPAILVGVTLGNGSPLIAGKMLTSFTNQEEKAAGFAEKMPFLLETRLRELGASFVERPNWSDHVEVDGNLITGQNPQSSRSAALAVIHALTKQQGE